MSVPAKAARPSIYGSAQFSGKLYSMLQREERLRAAISVRSTMFFAKRYACLQKMTFWIIVAIFVGTSVVCSIESVGSLDQGVCYGPARYTYEDYWPSVSNWPPV